MDRSVEEQVAEIQKAIRAQENLRDTLGDDLVEATIAALQEKLAGLTARLPDERKLVTCLFCDMVGSTRLAADRDPEEVLRIIDGALREMSTAVEQFSGFVARYMGDGILAFFGAPQALEGHAEQAILAGLKIQANMRDYASRLDEEHGLAEFSVRVGINSGYVVAGYVAGAAGEYTVIGNTINIAKRLEEAAPPGAVLVGENTFRLAGGSQQFKTKSWDRIEISGEPNPVKGFQILGRQTRADRRKAAGAGAKLAGRDRELKLVKERFKWCVFQRQAQVVEVVGEAGIGKSRLRQEFTAWLEETWPSARIWLGRAFSYTHKIPYAMVSSLLKSAVSIHETDTADQRREKLERGWSEAGNPRMEHLHGLGAILALEYPDDTLRKLAPQARRQAISEAFEAFCTYQAERNPLVLMFEDSQWADEVSLDLVAFMIEKHDDGQLYVLMLTRQTDERRIKFPNLRKQAHPENYTEIQLGHLTEGDTNRMISSLLSISHASEEIVSPILSITQGNPFFIEEIIRSFKEDGTLAPMNGGWRLARSLKGIRVPDTVQGVLAARIDRLDPDQKTILQHASIIGRSFWHNLLVDLVHLDVDAHLSALSDQDFVARQGRASLVDDWEWTFRHVLVQEVAYDGVLKETRRAVHHKIADWLEQHASDRLEELVPTLALHFERGQVWTKAIGYLAQAAERSKRLYALREATDMLDRAIDLATRNPQAIDSAIMLNLLQARGEVRGLAGEFEDAVEDLSTVLEAARREADRSRERDLLVGLGMIYRRADAYDTALAYLAQGLEAARSIGDRRGMSDALYHMGSVAWSQGDNVKSTAYHEEALEICRQLGLRDLVAVQALHGRGEAYYYSAQIRRAIGLLTESLDLAREIGDKSYEAENLQMLGMMYTGVFGIADYELAGAYASESLAISEEAHLHWHIVPALLTMASISLGLGEYQKGIDQASRAIEEARAIGALRLVSVGFSNLGDLYQDLNLLNRAEAAHSEGLSVGIKVGADFFLPRLKAQLAIDRLRRGNLGVGTDLEEALAEAKSRDQILLAMRCLEGLAELDLVRGDPESSYRRASELLQIAQEGELPEVVVRATIWQGKARLAARDPGSAEEALQLASEMADEIGSSPLRRDAHTALAELYRAQGKHKLAARHGKLVQAIIEQISANLSDPKLQKGLADLQEGSS